MVAVDHSARMLEAARAKIADEDSLDIELRHGEAGALPLEDDEVDAALAHMMLHYLPSPAEAIAEMARVVKPGGSVIAVDFVPHQLDWMRQELGVTWLGFSEAEVRSWFANVGLLDVRREQFEGLASSRDLPATFIVSGRRAS